MAALLIAAAAGTVIWVNAGDLNPPAGPVAPTMKPLDEVEPRIAINAINTPGDADSVFRISSPGSYYLTSDINGSSAKHGIEIASSGVSIDLMGFRVTGVGGSLHGITTSDATTRSGLSITNGHVRFWGQSGIRLNGDNHRVDRIGVQGNGLDGISVGNGAVVIGCTATGNSNHGLQCGQGAVVENCSATGNSDRGISLSDGSALSNCAASQNGGVGLGGGIGCTLLNCSAYDNGTLGIAALEGSTVSNCSAYGNSGSGISTLGGCTVSNCSAHGNSASGISVNTGSVVTGCTARINTSDGIVCPSNCLIRGNICMTNGFSGGDGAGIHATGNKNRIDGNLCSGADRGIDVDLSGNIIVRNTCSANNTNWVIAANNVCGPILDRTAPGSAAINGNSAPDSTGSAHPNANFTY